jgi:glucuronoarabinoxylan endo-1,4-beta-xylanase
LRSCSSAPPRAGSRGLRPAPFRVHADTTFQTILGFGAGYHAKSPDYFGHLQDPDAAYDALYGDKGPRLNVVRLEISANAAARPGGHGYDWAHDPDTQATWRAIAPALRRTKPIIYAVPFTPPAQWKANGKLTNGGRLKTDHYQDYADYLVDFLEYHHTVVGVDIDVLSLQNEPDVAARWDSCVWTGDEMRVFLKLLAKTVRERGLKTQLMATEGTSWTGAWQHLVPILQDADARAALDFMASHGYTPTGGPVDAARADFAAASARNGKPVWMSEISLMIPPQPDDPGMTAALKVADYLFRDLVRAHAAVWIYCFTIFRSDFQGSMGVLSPVNITRADKVPLSIPKRYWAIANYSHFIRPGWKLIQIDGDGDNTGFAAPDGNGLVIVALNSGTAPRTVEYDLGDRNLAEVEAFATTAELNLERVARPTTTAHGFSATLAPMSVTTFVGAMAHRSGGGDIR